MAKGALNAHQLQTPFVVEDAFNADDCVELEQSECYRGIVEINLASFELTLQIRGQSVHIHLQSDRKRRLWAHPTSDTAVLGASDSLVKRELLPPECFTTEG